jgi:hypothetical protein
VVEEEGEEGITYVDITAEIDTGKGNTLVVVSKL